MLVAFNEIACSAHYPFAYFRDSADKGTEDGDGAEGQQRADEDFDRRRPDGTEKPVGS